MNLAANCNIWLKCYIILCYIVADEKRCSKYLARAIANLKLILEKNIKNCKFYSFSFFVIVMIIWSFFDEIVQSNLSLSLRCNALTISTGTVVLKERECAVCKFTVDSNSNNFIFSFLSFVINMFVNKLYIFYQYFLYNYLYKSR